MIDISDLPNRLSTDKYRRDFDKHNAKVEKLYWQVAIIYLENCLNNQQKPDINLLVGTYQSIFFEYEKVCYAILEEFSGMSRDAIKDILDSSAESELKKSYNQHAWQVLKSTQSFLKRAEPDYRLLASESVTIVDMGIVDSRHPSLEPVSRNLKILLDAADHAYNENSLLLDTRNMHIPRITRKELHKSAEQLMLASLASHSLQYLKDFLLLGQEPFSPFTLVDGPKQAVLDAIGNNRGLKNLPFAALNYHIRLKYRSKSGTPFKQDSIDMALRRELNG